MIPLRTCSILALIAQISLSGCVGYPGSYGRYSMPMGNPGGYRYGGPVSYENNGYGYNQGYRSDHDRGDYREGGYNRGYGGYREHRHGDD